MTPSDWDRLFDVLTTGNDANLHDIFQKLGEFLLRVAKDRLRSKPELAEEAQDCTQNALLAIWQAIQKRSGPQHRGATKSWCISIIVHKVCDCLRKHGYSIKPTETENPELHNKMVELDEELASLKDALDELIDRMDRAKLLYKIFTHPKLKADERMILWMSFMEKMEDGEIAKRLGIAQVTVRVKRMRALQKLRDDPDLLDWLRSFL